ncbi:MAG: efflux RND transporter periplasmic adaptor subunit [Planctomycetaceae bacterium]
MNSETPSTDAESSSEPKAPAKPAVVKPTSETGGGGIKMELLRLAVSVAIIAAGIFGMLSFGQGQPPQKAAVEDAEAELVQAVDVVLHEGELDIEVDGVVVPFREIQIAAEVAGKITFKSEDCRTGNFVEANAPLVRIDQETYALEVDRLKKQKKETEQNLEELAVEVANSENLIKIAKDDLKLRESQFARQQRLGRVGTKSDLENAQQAVLQSQNSLATLENQKRLLTKRKARLETGKDLAVIQLSRAQLDLNRTEIKAPVSGVIVSEMIEKDSFVQRGAQLITIEDTSHVEVRCNLTMDELYRLWQATDDAPPDPNSIKTNQAYDIPNAKVSIMYELAGRTFVWAGRLGRFDGIGLDERTRTVPCRIVVDHPNEVKELKEMDSLVETKNGPRALVRGMYVNASIHTNPSAQFVRIPEAAVRPGNKVWLVRDGILAIRSVTVAGVVGDDIIVDAEASDIRPMERAIISPLTEAISGMPVKETSQ